MGEWTQTGSSIIFLPFTLEEALAGLAAAGFENVEIGAVKGFLEHLDPDDLGPDQIDRCRRLLDQHGLTCVSMSGHAPLHLEIGRTRLTNVLRAGKALGIEVLNTFTGDASTPEEVEAFTTTVRAVADEAGEAGIRLCIETDSNLLPTAAIGARILQAIDHPNVGINYDPGNVIFYGGVRPEDDIKKSADTVGHMHVKDQIGGPGVWNFPPTGTGEVDFKTIFAELDKAGFNGICSVEVEFQGEPWPALADVDAALKTSYDFARQYVK
jgi:sugar phosphate isomerase/epimerase